MSHSRSWLIGLVLAGTLVARVTGASEFMEKRFYVTPFGGWTFFDNERHFSSGQPLRDDVYFGGRAGVRLTSLLWLDLAGGYTSTEDCASCSENWVHGSGNIMLSPSTTHTFAPFVSLGGGASRYTPAAGPVQNSGTFEAAGGLRVRLGDSFGLRLEARNVLAVPKHDWGKAHIDDVIVGAGLTFAFGGTHVLVDSDGDGVPDQRDKCPNTPRGCTVDIFGCPSDTDGDGVCDGVDLCARTPAGATVDAKGCPSDADGDGVFNGIDQCPDTKSGCQVDARGCPLDTDGDGVCDGLDLCPNTPAETRVDASGCPVIDRIQRLETELLDTGRLRISDINFDYDKSTIRPEAFAVLDTVGRVLTKWPELRIEIGGHTDSRGSDAYNQRLSQRRAAAVREYLLAHFSQLEAAQLTSKGFGESEPLVPNTSPANMQQNRRVEFVVLNTENLKRKK